MKKLVCLLICFVIVAVPVMSMAKISVEYNGTEIAFPDAQPELKDGKPVLPMRAVFEALGAGVFWEEPDRMIMSQRGGKFVIMQIGSPVMFIGDAPVTLDTAPYIVSDRTMIDLKTITDALGVKAEWNAENSVVTITE